MSKPTILLLDIFPFGWSEPGEFSILNFCVGDEITVTAQDRFPEPNPDYQYTWHITGAATDTSSSVNQAFIEFLDEGDVYICVDIQDANCISTYCRTVRAHAIPDSVVLILLLLTQLMVMM